MICYKFSVIFTSIFFVITLGATNSKSLSVPSNEKDSLLFVVKNTESDLVRADTYANLGNYYFRKDPDTTRIYYKKAIDFYNKTDSLKAKGYALKMIGISFAMQGNLDSAICYSSKTLSIYKAIKDTLNLAFSYNNIGLMHIDNNQYQQGMKNLLKALEYKSKLKDKYPPEKLDVGGTMLNLGINFHYLQDHDNALKYYQQALAHYKIQDYDIGVAKAQMQIANAYTEMEQYRKADSLYNYLVKQQVFDKEPYRLSKLYNNYGSLLHRTKAYAKAKNILSIAYQLNMEQGNNRSAMKNLNNLADIALSEKNYTEAVKQAEKSYQIAKANHFVMQEKYAAEVLAGAYEKTGSYKQSVLYHNINAELTDSLYNSEQNKLLAEMEAKYHNAENEKELAVKTLKIERVKRSRFLFILLMGLFVLFSGFLYYLYTLRQKRNKALKVAINTKDKLISIISHDLKNPAIAQKMAIEQLIQHFDVIDENTLQKNLNALYRSSDSQVSLLLNLLNWAHTQSGPIELNSISFILNHVINDAIELFNTSAQNKQIQMKVDAADDLEVFADKDMVKTVVRNLLSNAIKFSHYGSSVTVKLHKDNDLILCQIKDNGLGMSEEKLRNLFELNRRELSKGTAGEEGSGLGLYLCKEMLERNGGILSIDSIEHKETTVVFTLPQPDKTKA